MSGRRAKAKLDPNDFLKYMVDDPSCGSVTPEVDSAPANTEVSAADVLALVAQMATEWVQEREQTHDHIRTVETQLASLREENEKMQKAMKKYQTGTTKKLSRLSKGLSEVRSENRRLIERIIGVVKETSAGIMNNRLSRQTSDKN